MATDTINARGHPNVRATHKSTLEITTEEHLTPSGDCIIAVAADKAAADLNPQLLRDLAAGSIIAVAIEAGDRLDILFAEGKPGHTPTSRTSIVIRKSTYTDSRTLAINSSKAARDIDRRLVALLQAATPVTIYLATAPTTREAIIALAELLAGHGQPLMPVEA